MSIVPVRAGRAARLAPAVRWSAAVLGWLVGSWVLGGTALFLLPIVLLAALVLVPAGFAYGVVIRSVLIARRRRAARSPVSTPPRFGQRLRRTDAVLAVLLLAIAVLGGAFLIVDAVLDANGFVGGNTSAPGNVLLAAGALETGFVVELLVAIPITAVNITRQAIDAGLLAEEARLLQAGGPDARRVRAVRLLSWGAYAVCSAGAVWVIVDVIPSFA